MEFVPSDHMTIDQVVDGVVEADHGSLLTEMRSHAAELERMTGILAKAHHQAEIHNAQIVIPARWSARLEALQEERRRGDAAREEAINRVWQALGDGALASTVLSDQGFAFPLPLAFWRAAGGRQSVVTGRVRWWLFEANPPSPLNGRAIVKRADFERWIVGGATVARERRLTNWLAEEMSASPRVPVSKMLMKKRARSAGHQFSDESFDRAWASAADAANAPAWSRPGRRAGSK